MRGIASHRNDEAFDIITEADARGARDRIARVALKPGGHVTPLAADTLKARRITVLRDVADASLDGLAPVADIQSLAIGSDHSGVALKAHCAITCGSEGLSVLDVGTEGPDPVDYPDIAAAGRAAGRAQGSRRRHRHRRRGPRLGDRRQQD